MSARAATIGRRAVWCGIHVSGFYHNLTAKQSWIVWRTPPCMPLAYVALLMVWPISRLQKPLSHKFQCSAVLKFGRKKRCDVCVHTWPIQGVGYVRRIIVLPRPSTARELIPRTSREREVPNSWTFRTTVVPATAFAATREPGWMSKAERSSHPQKLHPCPCHRNRYGWNFISGITLALQVGCALVCL